VDQARTDFAAIADDIEFVVADYDVGRGASRRTSVAGLSSRRPS